MLGQALTLPVMPFYAQQLGARPHELGSIFAAFAITQALPPGAKLLHLASEVSAACRRCYLRRGWGGQATVSVGGSYSSQPPLGRPSALPSLPSHGPITP